MDQEEVDVWYISNRNNMHEQGRLLKESNGDAACSSPEWINNRQDKRTVEKLDEKRV